MTKIIKKDKTQLINTVDTATIRVRTRTADVSFNELFDMFKSDELVITPDFQRLFRWSESKQSQFIESLILELPVPPIYVIETDEGVYELIDGLQRISSYFHFRGTKVLVDENNDVIGYDQDKFLVLQDCDVIKDLNGLSYNDLPSALQIKLKRHFIRMEVLRRESDNRLRYHMFKRLNTGGETLSEQEMRNCTIRLLDNSFNNFLKELAKEKSFQICMSGLSDEKKEQMYMEEYVLRFFAMKNYRSRYQKILGDFLTEYMEKVSDPDVSNKLDFDYALEKKIFVDTFKILTTMLDDSAFLGVNSQGNSQGYFSALHFEALTLGIQPHLDALLNLGKLKIDQTKREFRKLKSEPAFQKLTKGGGKNYAAALTKRINFVDNWIKKCLV